MNSHEGSHYLPNRTCSKNSLREKREARWAGVKWMTAGLKKSQQGRYMSNARPGTGFYSELGSKLEAILFFFSKTDTESEPNISLGRKLIWIRAAFISRNKIKNGNWIGIQMDLKSVFHRKFFTYFFYFSCLPIYLFDFNKWGYIRKLMVPLYIST